MDSVVLISRYANCAQWDVVNSENTQLTKFVYLILRTFSNDIGIIINESEKEESRLRVIIWLPPTTIRLPTPYYTLCRKDLIAFLKSPMWCRDAESIDRWLSLGYLCAFAFSFSFLSFVSIVNYGFLSLCIIRETDCKSSAYYAGID